MTCENEYSFVCLTNEKAYHWLWILLPICFIIIIFLYIFSRPNYARLSSRTYKLMTSSKNIHPLSNAFNQHAKYSTPTLLSKDLFEQCKERTNEINNRLLNIDNIKNKTNCESNNNLNKSNVLISSELLNNTSINNSNDVSINFDSYKWNEFRTPVLTNYPDLIDPKEACRINNKLNPQIKNQLLLSNDIYKLINKGFDEYNSYSIENNLGRIWFFLEYNPYLRKLYLTIIKARNLHSINNCQPTTFVRAEILPTLNINFSTDIIKENSNPDYMTEIIFDINLSEFPHNVLKLTVHEIDKDVFHIPIGTTYYPLDHLLIAQRAKGHAVWRNLLPDYGDPSAIGLIQIRATVWYDAKDECLNIYVHSLRATGIVKHVNHVYVHATVGIHDHPVIPEEHIESNQISKIPVKYNKCGRIVSLEQNNDTIYDQLFRFNIYKREFKDITVVLDVYRRSLGEKFYDDILLGRTILISPEMLAKNINNDRQIVPTKIEESKTNQEKKKKRRRKKKKR